LAATILKLGTLGLLKIIPSLPLPFLLLGLVGRLVCPIITFLQRDAKRLIAYSRVAHIGRFLVSLCLLSTTCVEGRRLLQIAHGLVSSALFLVVGSLSHLAGSRTLYNLSIKNQTLLFSLCGLNSGAPLSLPFLAEILFYTHLRVLGVGALLSLLGLALGVTYYSTYLVVRLCNNNQGPTLGDPSLASS
jgi:NADH-quinone oxidoreductase subunit M